MNKILLFLYSYSDNYKLFKDAEIVDSEILL